MTLAAVCLFVFLMQQTAARTEFVYGYSYGHVLLSCFGLNGALLSRGFFFLLAGLFLRIPFSRFLLGLFFGRRRFLFCFGFFFLRFLFYFGCQFFSQFFLLGPVSYTPLTLPTIYSL